MTDFMPLAETLKVYAGLNDDDLALAAPLWRRNAYSRADFFNAKASVCQSLGFVLDGVFRVYYPDPTTGEDSNVFFFAEGQFCVSFKSFTTQTPCEYYLEALTDAQTLEISFADLSALYRQSHNWERFGRKFAEDCFNISQARAESFLFLTPEERYLGFLKAFPNLVQRIPLYHISSFLGIQNPSLSRIRRRLAEKAEA